MIAYSLFFHQLFWFSCAWFEKITFIENPLCCYTFFLFRHSIRHFRHDLISVRNLLQPWRRCGWTWEINLKISWQLSKIKRLWICSNLLLIFQKILKSCIFFIVISFFYIRLFNDWFLFDIFLVLTHAFLTIMFDKLLMKWIEGHLSNKYNYLGIQKTLENL